MTDETPVPVPGRNADPVQTPETELDPVQVPGRNALPVNAPVAEDTPAPVPLWVGVVEPNHSG